MQKFKLVHPIIYSIIELKKNYFKVKERLEIGGIPFTSGYLVAVNSNKAEGIIQMNAVVKRLIKIEITFTLSSQGAFTVVDEIILFKSFYRSKVYWKECF
ncbi:MAG: hypothetical protein IPP71_09320 [Bacteroidetes bacterium]|nr:hypothetical protein [Bacteroidota bacterium]